MKYLGPKSCTLKFNNVSIQVENLKKIGEFKSNIQEIKTVPKGYNINGVTHENLEDKKSYNIIIDNKTYEIDCDYEQYVR